MASVLYQLSQLGEGADVTLKEPCDRVWEHGCYNGYCWAYCKGFNWLGPWFTLTRAWCYTSYVSPELDPRNARKVPCTHDKECGCWSCISECDSIWVNHSTDSRQHRVQMIAAEFANWKSVPSIGDKMNYYFSKSRVALHIALVQCDECLLNHLKCQSISNKEMKKCVSNWNGKYLQQRRVCLKEDLSLNSPPAVHAQGSRLILMVQTRQWLSMILSFEGSSRMWWVGGHDLMIETSTKDVTTLSLIRLFNTEREKQVHSRHQQSLTGTGGSGGHETLRAESDDVRGACVWVETHQLFGRKGEEWRRAVISFASQVIIWYNRERVRKSFKDTVWYLSVTCTITSMCVLRVW